MLIIFDWNTALNKSFNRYSQNIRQIGQIVQIGGSLATFQFAYVGRGYAHALCQLFLGHTLGFADVSEDEQAWANGYLEHMTCPNGETVVMPASPIVMESVGKVETTPAPKIGTHTEEVLQQLGYSAEEIEAMEAKGTIARLK